MLNVWQLGRRRKLAIGVAAAAAASVSAVAVAQIPNGVPDANPRAGSPVNVVAGPFNEYAVAHGSDQLENPSGPITRYGYLNDQPASNPAAGVYAEPTKTEPDGNTYLNAGGLGGPTRGFNYGSHFLFQSHENGKLNTGGTGFQAYITRINLDVTDPTHRITLLTPPDAQGNTNMSRLDGSVFDPFNGEILGAQEGNGTNGGIVGVEARWSSTTPPGLNTYYGSIGRGGYEGIRFDSKGNLIVLEDVGGSSVNDPDPAQSGKKAKVPNSFVYRFVPADGRNLDAGKLQVLQVSVDGKPVAFHGTGGCADGSGKTAVDDTFGPEILKLHSGTSYPTKWVTIHDTAVDGSAAFDANAKAKLACGTPFKRPENGGFIPGTSFRSYLFDETGDTDATSGGDPNAAARGAWGSIYRLDSDSVGSTTGKLKVVVNGDATHASFDTLALLDEDTVVTGEDRGETMHQQLNKLDSLWSFDLDRPLSQITSSAKRLVAQGRDPAATADAEHIAPNAATSPSPATYQNEGDNEVTGVVVGNGAANVQRMLGSSSLFSSLGSRMFYTQQHGDNVTYELRSANQRGNGDDGDD